MKRFLRTLEADHSALSCDLSEYMSQVIYTYRYPDPSSWNLELVLGAFVRYSYFVYS